MKSLTKFGKLGTFLLRHLSITATLVTKLTCAVSPQWSEFSHITPAITPPKTAREDAKMVRRLLARNQGLFNQSTAVHYHKCQRWDNDILPRVSMLHAEAFDEESHCLICAENFFLALNPNCSSEIFARRIENGTTFNALQVLVAIRAYYKGTLPNTKKTLSLLAKTEQLYTHHNTLRQSGSNLLELPGVLSKASEGLKKNTFCSTGQKHLWICRWVQARSTLLQLYQDSLANQAKAKNHDIFNSSCPSGAFNPHTFLTKLETEEDNSMYLFCHMEIHDFANLAYAWIPALYNTDTRELFSDALNRHLTADPEKQTLETIVNNIAHTIGRYEEDLSLQGFKSLIQNTWEILDSLKAPVSKRQWAHCVTLLKTLNSAQQYIDENPSIVQFRHRTFPMQPKATSKAAYCIKHDLSTLLAIRHEWILKQRKALQPHKAILEKRVDVNDVCKTTDALFTTYAEAISMDRGPLQHICALMTQQSALLHSQSFMRSTLLWAFAYETPNTEHRNTLQTLCTDRELMDLAQHEEDHFVRSKYFTSTKKPDINGSLGLSPWYMTQTLYPTTQHLQAFNKTLTTRPHDITQTLLVAKNPLKPNPLFQAYILNAPRAPAKLATPETFPRKPYSQENLVGN